MIKKSVNAFLLMVSTFILILCFIGLQSYHVEGIKFEPVPFDNIPIARISSDNDEYNLGADFSIDFGSETVINNNILAKYAENMEFGKGYNNTLSLELICDDNDECGTVLAPDDVKLYLVDIDITDNQIAENTIPTLDLVTNDCDDQPIEYCAKIDFSLHSNILVKEYKIVIDISFDEARWIFINPITILE